MFLLNLNAKRRKSGSSCPSADPQKALDPSLSTRSALLKKWARGSVSLFNFSLKELREVMLISQPVLSAPPLDSSLMVAHQFPASDFRAKGWLEAYFGTTLPERLTGKLHFRQFRRTLLYMCSHTSNFLLLLLKAYLWDYTVKAFFITSSTISHM